MTDPVNPSSEPINNQQVLSSSQEVGTTVNSGYNTQDSTSYIDTVSEISPSTEDISELAQSGSSQLKAGSYLSAALLNRVNSFQKNLTDFNTNFFNQYKDNTLALLKGGSTLIMFLSGSLHGFKVMRGLNTILVDSSTKDVKLNKENERLEVKQQLKDLDESINNLNLEKQQKASQINRLYDQVQNKNNELASLNNQDNDTSVAPEIIEALEQEINDLLIQSNNLITSFNDTNQQLEQQVTIKDHTLNQQQLLTYLISSLDESITSTSNILKGAGIKSINYLDKIAEQLEKSTDKITAENIEDTEKLNSTNKEILATELRKEELKTYSINNVNANTENRLLNTDFLRKLLTIFSPSSVPSIYGAENNNPLPENIQQPVALVLSADINDKKFPDLAHKQPYLGDSISLDGADNPQAYSMILLMHNMELLEQSITATENLQQAEEKEQTLIQKMFDLQNEVDFIVFDSLNQANAPDFQRRIQV